MLAVLTASDIALVLGAYTALTLGAWGVLVKFAVSARSEAANAKTIAASVYRAVNHRPEGEPTLYELVAKVDESIDLVKQELPVIRWRLTQLEAKTPNKETP